MKISKKLLGIAFAAALLALFSSTTPAQSSSFPCSQRMVTGCVLTTLDGVDVYFNGWDPSDDQGAYEFGYKWQCVELIQRYYYEKFGYAKIWAPLYAFEAFDSWGHPDRMAAYPNGNDSTPRKADILVFGRTWDNPYGHVALVKSVENGRITFVEQNYYATGEDSLPIDAGNNVDSQGRYGPLRGWLRDTGGPAATLDALLSAFGATFSDR